MAEFKSEAPVMEMKCNTCKASFCSSDLIKEHYRSDIHVMNSKRRSNGLKCIRMEEWELLVKNKKPKPVQMLSPGVKTYVPVKAKIEAKPTAAKPDNTTPSSPIETEADTETVVEKEIPPPKLGTNISIFDDKEFENVDDCVSHMAVNFGFFIPDIEHLKDMNGLLNYLGEKVKLGGYCLYCQRKFGDYRSCQNHMISKSHCKIAYQEDVDVDEFDDFYDFSSSYEDVQLDENGEEISDEMEISAIGELVLPGGRTLGHRDFRVYYKQHYKPEEERPSVLAQQREELLRLGYQMGGAKAATTRADIANLSDTQVMTMLVKVQKDIRRGQMVEQRGAMRRMYLDQRREFASTKDKLRSSENTTAKIRDYHGLL